MINTENYCEDIRTIGHAPIDLADKATQLKQLLERLCKEATQSEAMQFSTLFSRLVFIAQKHHLPKKTEWELQNFRVKVKEQRKNNIPLDLKTYQQSEQAIFDLCQHLSADSVSDKASDKASDNFTDNISDSNVDSNVDNISDNSTGHTLDISDQSKQSKQIIQSKQSTVEAAVEKPLQKETPNNQDTKPTDSIPTDSKPTDSTPPIEDWLRVQILSIDKENHLLQCAVENSPGKQVTVRYNVTPHNAIFTPSVEQFKESAQLNLVDFTIDAEGCLVPKIIVLEPDYLIDASAIAMCFNNYSVSHLHYFMNKFQLMENRDYLLLGNLANYFLDELIFADNPEELQFDKVFLQSFKQSPFEYATCEDIMSDDGFRKFMDKARNQFHNIKRVIAFDFPQQNINPRKSTLEPSFFSQKYGFQGRLDLLQTGHEGTPYKIVELKSGRLPFPYNDAGKVALGHEVQTAVYRMMIESVYNITSRDIDVAILYSAGDHPGQNLRFAAIYQQLEKEIINLRNLIVHNEYAISQGSITDVQAQFRSLRTMIDTSARVPDFFVQNIRKVEDTLIQCSPLERIYFYRFVQFISKELYLQKIGDIAHESPVGVAALWNSEFWERAEALDLLFDLTIASIDDSANDMKIVFSRTTHQNELVNFREGDICIVYPRNSHTDSVLNNQILKGVVSRINADEVEVRFRYKQRNKKHFANNTYWAIEHDTMDSSYNSMYKSLFSFLSASRAKRSLLLGITPPTAAPVEVSASTPYIDQVIAKAMVANNYFLIVGPPGTGKTSIFARRLIGNYHADTSKNILVLAYTNRAVNELCEAVNAAFGCTDGECDKFIRVGSELSCGQPYRHRLLQNISEKSPNRATLLDEIKETRIFISTLSSINGRQELFNLKKFDVAIIDEASQILEPQLMGVLSMVEKFILIGDHNQLATIVLQNEYSSAVQEQALLDMGLQDCRISFFERLLQTCKKNQWTLAFSQLIHQGRMHADIASFPSKFFYDNNLFPIKEWQSHPLKLTDSDDGNERDGWIANNRMLFLSTENLDQTSAGSGLANSLANSSANSSANNASNNASHDGSNNGSNNASDNAIDTESNTVTSTASNTESKTVSNSTSNNASNKINYNEANTIVTLVQSLIKVYAQSNQPLQTSQIGIIAPYRNQIALIKQQLALANIPDHDQISVDTVERYQGSQRDIILLSFCVNKAYQLDFLCNLNIDGTVDRKLNVALTRARKQLFMVGNAHILRRHPIYATLLDFVKEKTVVLEG